jgi:hypothetical protein
LFSTRFAAIRECHHQYPNDSTLIGGMKKVAKKAAKKPVETIDQVAARLRGQYRKHTPEQREIYGGEPSEGTIMGEWIRAQGHVSHVRTWHSACLPERFAGRACRLHSWKNSHAWHSATDRV